MAVRKVRRQSPGQEIDALIAVVAQLVTLANELKADVNGIVAKLDADAGVTDTNYAALRGISAADADTISVTY
jgi:hypothetical protein